MKTEFSGYLRPTPEEFAEIWAGGVIVIDASALLNIYGYSDSTKEELFASIEKFTDRLWIPHQFSWEFVRNRPGVIIKQAKNCQRVRTQLQTLIDQDFRAKNTHPFASEEVLTKLSELCSQLDSAAQVHFDMVHNDPLLNRILTIFNGKVGKPYASDRLDELYAQARQRYMSKTPPGYADKDKPEPESLGDFVAWRQIVDYAKGDHRSVILITDDAKEDWWHIYDGRTLGPRPELLSEFRAECGAGFYMYSTASFMKHAPAYSDTQVSAAALDELNRIRAARQAQERPEKGVELPVATPEPLAKGVGPAEGSDSLAKGGN